MRMRRTLLAALGMVCLGQMPVMAQGYPRSQQIMRWIGAGHGQGYHARGLGQANCNHPTYGIPYGPGAIDPALEPVMPPPPDGSILPPSDSGPPAPSDQSLFFRPVPEGMAPPIVGNDPASWSPHQPLLGLNRAPDDAHGEPPVRGMGRQETGGRWAAYRPGRMLQAARSAVVAEDSVVGIEHVGATTPRPGSTPSPASLPMTTLPSPVEPTSVPFPSPIAAPPVTPQFAPAVPSTASAASSALPPVREMGRLRDQLARPHLPQLRFPDQGGISERLQAFQSPGSADLVTAQAVNSTDHLSLRERWTAARGATAEPVEQPSAKNVETTQQEWRSAPPTMAASAPTPPATTSSLRERVMNPLSQMRLPFTSQQPPASVNLPSPATTVSADTWQPDPVVPQQELTVPTPAATPAWRERFHRPEASSVATNEPSSQTEWHPEPLPGNPAASSVATLPQDQPLRDRLRHPFRAPAGAEGTDPLLSGWLRQPGSASVDVPRPEETPVGTNAMAAMRERLQQPMKTGGLADLRNALQKSAAANPVDATPAATATTSSAPMAPQPPVAGWLHRPLETSSPAVATEAPPSNSPGGKWRNKIFGDQASSTDVHSAPATPDGGGFLHRPASEPVPAVAQRPETRQ